jgi:hypothetical protein
MIDELKKTKSLTPFITDKCEENQICVTMDNSIPKTNYVVIKVDDHYNSLRLKKTPPSVDCLITVKCRDNGYIIYLVELKNIKSPAGFKIDNVYNKFKTTIEDFMEILFRNIFHNPKYNVKRLHLYFVTDPYGKRRLRTGTTKMDSLLSRKPFKFQGKLYMLNHKLPNPMITNC